MAYPTPANAPALTTPVATTTVTTIVTIFQQMPSTSTARPSSQQTPQSKTYRGHISDAQLFWMGFLTLTLLVWCVWFLWGWQGPQALNGEPNPEPDADSSHSSTPSLTTGPTRSSSLSSSTQEDAHHGLSNGDQPPSMPPSSRPGEEDPSTTQSHTDLPRPQESNDQLEDQLAGAERNQYRHRLQDGGPEGPDVAPRTVTSQSPVTRPNQSWSRAIHEEYRDQQLRVRGGEPETNWSSGSTPTGDSAVRRSHRQSSRSLQEVETQSESRDTHHDEPSSMGGEVNELDWIAPKGRSDLTNDTDNWEA